MDSKPTRRLAKADQQRILRRALAAYYAAPSTTGWPDPQSSGFIRRDGLHYVVLHDLEMATLAVYRLHRNDTRLKLMTQPPRWAAG